MAYNKLIHLPTPVNSITVTISCVTILASIYFHVASVAPANFILTVGLGPWFYNSTQTYAQPRMLFNFVCWDFMVKIPYFCQLFYGARSCHVTFVQNCMTAHSTCYYCEEGFEFSILLKDCFEAVVAGFPRNKRASSQWED